MMESIVKGMEQCAKLHNANRLFGSFPAGQLFTMKILLNLHKTVKTLKIWLKFYYKNLILNDYKSR